MARGQELNTQDAQIRTLLDRQKEQISANFKQRLEREFQADYDRTNVQKFIEIIEFQQEELRCAQTEELQRRNKQILHK